MRIDVPDAQPASSMSRNPKAYKRLPITDRTPSKRAGTARSPSRVNTTGRLAGSLVRSIPSSQPHPFLNIRRLRDTIAFGACFYVDDGTFLLTARAARNASLSTAPRHLGMPASRGTG